MTEWHPGPDELVDLALANPTGPLRGELSQHLVACEACRREYAEIAAAVDQVVVAAPQSEPPPGFDQRAVAAMLAGSRRAPDRPPSRRRLRVLVAVGAVVGALVGAGGTAALLGREPAATTAAVVTADGDRVGAVVAGSVEGRDVLVVEVDGAPSGATYGCRVVLEDGSVRTVGTWTIGAYGNGATWVVPVPGEVTTVELVAESGAVWATADL